MVTSSILDILLTKMLTETTAGPSVFGNKFCNEIQYFIRMFLITNDPKYSIFMKNKIKVLC